MGYLTSHSTTRWIISRRMGTPNTLEGVLITKIKKKKKKKKDQESKTKQKNEEKKRMKK